MHRRVSALALVVLAVIGTLALAPAEAADLAPVPVPTVVGPVADEVGLKGEPWFDPPFVLEDAEPFAYTSEEYFLEGTARPFLSAGANAAYKTRILVVRPVDAADFSGTAVVEWDNVTAQAALNPLWIWNQPYLMREGHAFVTVSAQAIGVCCSPVSHNFWDPARYGDLFHPGDAYSYDIFAQAVEALRQNPVSSDGIAGGTPKGGALPVAPIAPTAIAGGTNVMGDLAVTNVIATGTSQSAGYLHTYLERVQGDFVDNIDGILLDAGGSRVYRRNPVVPTIHFLSEDGLSATTPNVAGQSLLRPDSSYRLWEVPGASHADSEFSRYIEDGLYMTHIAEAPPIPWKQWDDRRYSFRYGDEGAGLRTGCQPLGYGDNTYPRRYAARAAMDQLVQWTTNDDFVAIQPPRVQYDATGEARDANRQVIGGVRLPQIDVPVADYMATTCGLFGHTISFDPVSLNLLYPTTADYVAAMEAAIVRALDAGFMLAPEADELRVQLETAVIPAYRSAEAPGDTAEGVAHFLGALAG